MFLEYPQSDMTGVRKSFLAVRIILSTSMSEDGKTASYGAVVRGIDGISISAGSPHRWKGGAMSVIARSLWATLLAHVDDLEGRDVDFRTDSLDLMETFQRHARGGVTGNEEMDRVFLGLDRFCRRHSTTLTVRLAARTMDHEVGMLNLLAGHLCEEGLEAPTSDDPRTKVIAFGGSGWRSDLVEWIRARFGSRNVPIVESGGRIRALLGISRSTIALWLDMHGLRGVQAECVEFVTLFAHVMGEIVPEPSGADLVFAVESGGGRCQLIWKDGIWIIHATGSSDGDPLSHAKGHVVTSKSDIISLAERAGGVDRCPWVGLHLALLDVARLGAMAAGNGVIVADAGIAADLCGWVEGHDAFGRPPVFVFSDISSTSDFDVLGIGYVTVGEGTVGFGHERFVVDTGSSPIHHFEPFASLHALTLATNVMGNARRVVLVTDAINWARAASAHLAGGSVDKMGPMLDGIDSFMARTGIVVDVLWQRGHTNGIHPFNVGNILADRLALIGRMRTVPVRRHVLTKDWMRDSADGIRALERTMGGERTVGPLTVCQVANMLGGQDHEVRSWLASHKIRIRRGLVAWHDVVSVLKDGIVRSATHVDRPANEDGRNVDDDRMTA